MKTEIDSTNYAQWLAAADVCTNLVFQGLDLRPDDEKLAALHHAQTAEEGCVFLGCKLGNKLACAAASHHALIFPEMTGHVFKPFRHALYTVEELFEGYAAAAPNAYYSTPDWQIYLSFAKVDEHHKPLNPQQLVPVGLDEILARRIHDNFVVDEMHEFLEDFHGTPGKRGVVAIMGGHDKRRSDKDFKPVAALARQLTLDGYLVATGGGPGFMEAANLGAFFAQESEDTLFAAIDSMAVPNASDKYSDPQWLEAAWRVREQYLPRDWSVCRSLGIPTWFYGHEPPNVFASHIAKYFENSLREEGLLAIATHGIVFAEGNGGTVQEIFQDACQNYYATYGHRSPMILFNQDYWQPKAQSLLDGYPVYPEKVFPAWPLLQGLAQKKSFTDLISITSDTEQVLATIREFKAPWEVLA